MGPVRIHDKIVSEVAKWLAQYNFIVLKSYSLPVMDTDTAVRIAFGEARKKEQGGKYERWEPIVKPDLLAQHREFNVTIAVEVALTSNPTDEADKLAHLKSRVHLDLRPLIVTSSWHEGWIGKIPLVNYENLDDVLMLALATKKMRKLELAIKKRSSR
jgi:hypothetical protein